MRGSDMHYQAAYSYLKAGKAITLPEWGGYWSWGERRGTVLMHTRKGEIIDIRQSEDWEFTQSFMFRDDWSVVDDIHATEHYQARHGKEPEKGTSWGTLKTDHPPARDCLLCHGHHSPGLPCPEAQTWSRS